MWEGTPCIYLLASGYNGTLYTGVTSHIVARMIQHREGIFDGFTRRYRVNRLVWFDTGESMEAAIKREKTIKKWPREWKRNLIERDNPEWNDLAVGLACRPSESIRCGLVDPGTSPG